MRGVIAGRHDSIQIIGFCIAGMKLSQEICIGRAKGFFEAEVVRIECPEENGRDNSDAGEFVPSLSGDDDQERRHERDAPRLARRAALSN